MLINLVTLEINGTQMTLMLLIFYKKLKNKNLKG